MSQQVESKIETTNKVKLEPKYFDFAANWDEFYKYLHSPLITKMLARHGLTHPLYKCARGDGMHQIIMDLAQEEMDEIQKTRNFEDNSDDEEEFSEMYDIYFEKHSQPKMIHSNIPSGNGHHIVESLFKIAQLMYPEKKWVMLQGEYNSLVYNPEEKIVFDLLMWFHSTHMTCDSYKAPAVLREIFEKKIWRPDGSTTLTYPRFEQTIYHPKLKK